MNDERDRDQPLNGLSWNDIMNLRGMIQKAGWAQFMSHVASLMAEQADKVERDSVQEKAMFNISVAFHGPAFRGAFAELGWFDYRKLGSLAFRGEDAVILDRYPPTTEIAK